MNLKVELFRQIFRGRQDIVPRHWISKDGKRQGYTPLCKNEWKDEVCQKPCRNCQNADYVPLSDSLILSHFKGNHILGVYPLLKDNTCYFIASDFDNHNGNRNPLSDILSLYETCRMQEIPAYILRSKSGKGYHVYIFFVSPVAAWKARIVVFALLQEAGVIGEDVKLSSFDRLFPNQDELTGKRLGNLIALPFQGQAAKQGQHTLFLNPETNFLNTFGDQWDVLSNIKKVDESILNDLIESWDLKRSQHSINNRVKANPEGWLVKALMGVEEGNPGRDTTGTKIAGYFVNKLPKQDILTILLAWNTRNKPPLEGSVISKIVDSVYRYKENGEPKNGEAKRTAISFS